MTFNPIEDRRNQKYTYQELKTFWQGPGRIVQRTKEQNPTLYAELHAAGEAANLIGKSLSPNPQPYVKNYEPAPRQYSADELAAHGRHSEADVRAFFADAKKANEVFTSDRNLYEQWRESAVAFGMFKSREVPYVPVKLPEPEPLHRISDLLADESHLERGTSLPWEQVQQLVAQKVQRDRQVQEAVAAKAESDRQLEIEKLTTAQKLEQDKRDKEVRDLQRLSELIAPKPIVTPEPIALETARAIAQERKSVEVPIIGQ